MDFKKNEAVKCVDNQGHYLERNKVYRTTSESSGFVSIIDDRGNTIRVGECMFTKVPDFSNDKLPSLEEGGC